MNLQKDNKRLQRIKSSHKTRSAKEILHQYYFFVKFILDH